MAVTIEQLLKRGGKPLEDKKRGSVQWFLSQVRGIRKENKKPGEPKGRTGYVFKTNNDLPGQMVMFSYDPKHKKTLPYYDRYPVVIPLALDGRSMLGLNLHYLPPRVRLSFIRALQTLVEEKNGVRRMKITYGIVKSAQGLSSYLPCLKRYLHSHMKSQVVQVDDRDWEHAALLPIARFVGASESDVWSDSMSGGKNPNARRIRAQKAAQAAAVKKAQVSEA